MIHVYQFFLCLLMMCCGIAKTYVPTTWINGAPNNLYAPLCLTNAPKENDRSPWQGDVQANCFILAQWSNILYGKSQACGVALRGHIQMDRLLHGLYAQINTSALINHEKSYDQTLGQIKYHNLASLADTHFLIGWNAINNPRVHFSGYAFGLIPATKHSLFDPKKKIYWIGLDNHFAWGLGIESSVRLWGIQEHHIDWLNDIDTTFLTHRKEIAWARKNNIYQPYQIKLHSNQLYKIRSALAYQFEYFVSDIGIQGFYMPSLKYNTPVDPASKEILEPATQWRSLFCDIGASAKLYNLPSYVLVGAQTTGHNDKFDSWSINFKLGITF